MSKMTAVDWLYSMTNLNEELYKQAKEIEKDQIMDAYSDYMLDGKYSYDQDKLDRFELMAEDYYNYRYK